MPPALEVSVGSLTVHLGLTERTVDRGKLAGLIWINRKPLNSINYWMPVPVDQPAAVIQLAVFPNASTSRSQRSRVSGFEVPSMP